MASESPGGTVVQVNRKPELPGQHGLPKAPTNEARLTVRGVEGDFNRYRHEEKRDDPDMALLVVPIEILHQLNREGWPVRPGDFGENVTSAGIANEEFRVGRRFRVGTALAQVAKPCDPCTNLYLLPYVGHDRGPEFIKTTLGRRGWYCRVLEEGVLRPGDAIRLDPP